MSKKKNPITTKSTMPSKLDFYYNKNIHYLILFSAAFILYGWTYTFKYNLDDDYILDFLKTIDTNINGVQTIFTR